MASAARKRARTHGDGEEDEKCPSLLDRERSN